MRHDVVDDRCLGVPSLLPASNAQGIRTKECSGLLLPARSVSFLCCCPLLLTVKRCVLGAVLTAVRNKPCATRVLARCVRSSRHCFLPSQKPAGFPHWLHSIISQLKNITDEFTKQYTFSKPFQRNAPLYRSSSNGSIFNSCIPTAPGG